MKARGSRTRLACGWGGVVGLAASLTLGAQNPRNQRNPGPETFTTRVVASGLANPWELTWGPDGHLWLTERTGFRVLRVNPADGSRQALLTLDDVHQSVVQDGLLGLALHPDLLRGRGRDFVFLAYTYDHDPGAAVSRRIRVRRYTYNAKARALENPHTVIDDVPAHDDHGAGRLAIGQDGKLYFTRGDLGSNFLTNFCSPIRSQDLPDATAVRNKDWSTYQGKVLRLNLDGSIPDDNPKLAGVRSHIYALGFRNPQGLAFDSSERLYVSDHGPSTDDEINLVRAGGNYGWPRVAGFKDDRAYEYANWSASTPTPCAELTFDHQRPPSSVPRSRESEWQDPAFVPPIATLFTVPPDYDVAISGNATVGPAGIEVYTAPHIPGWANSILLAGMQTGTLYRVKLHGGGRRVEGAPMEYFRTTNRYRDVAVHPDGSRIFLATDSMGSMIDPAGGRRTDALSSPGAIIEHAYVGRVGR